MVFSKTRRLYAQVPRKKHVPRCPPPCAPPWGTHQSPLKASWKRMTDEPMTAASPSAQASTHCGAGGEQHRCTRLGSRIGCCRGADPTAVSLSMSTDGCVNVRIQALSAAASLDHYRERGNAPFKASGTSMRPRATGRLMHPVCATGIRHLQPRARADVAAQGRADPQNWARRVVPRRARRALMDASRGAARLDPACAQEGVLHCRRLPARLRVSTRSSGWKRGSRC